MESQFTFDFNPVSAIVADAVGRPGQRTFFLQARQGADMATLLMEKEQVAALATSILQLLEELEKERATCRPSRKRPPYPVCANRWSRPFALDNSGWDTMNGRT